jgi:hypothetical protein
MASSKRGAATTGKLFVGPGFGPGIFRPRSAQFRPPHQSEGWSIPLSTKISCGADLHPPFLFKTRKGAEIALTY